ncbi:hypothetical protein DFH07DRAFT_797613 [Mycena maculata]|uniref:Cell division cycle protein 123 n=1 Tax=Mycena maculata TaxID=230809 RepID=A0AAD7NVE6_9AGAR|nr:hypothetical protein DFH07DRAFT_797613 [Mycena maculata]
MWLNVISSAEVSRSIAEGTELFNACRHDPSLLPPTLAGQIPTAVGDVRATFYGPWIKLIMRLRNINPNDLHTVILTPYYAKLLLDASTVAMLNGRLSQSHREDLLDPSPFDHLYQQSDATEASPPRYFARYDVFSPKDSPLRAPLTSPQAVVDQLATSQRSNNSILEALKDDSPIRLYFMPWDDTMDTRREYRVFCAPTSEYHPQPSRVTAFSQYAWHKRSLLADLPRAEIEVEMQHLLQGVHRIHAEIMAYSVENGMHERLSRDGFVFDVYVHMGTREVQLLELNPFGVTSSCGSCLFNWVTDVETLYGGKDEIEVRVSV